MEKQDKSDFPDWFTSFSFSLPVATEAAESFKRMEDENMEFHAKIQERIIELFKQFVELNDEVSEDVRNLLRNIFAYGYTNGWNDFKAVIDNKNKAKEQ